MLGIAAVNDPAKWLLDLAAPQLLTIDEAAARLALDMHLLEQLIAEGSIRTLSFKDIRLIATYELDHYGSAVNGMGIFFDENQYVGVNPHLMSELQTPGSGSNTSLYPDFHLSGIAQIKNTLNRELLPPGYRANAETSLQISSKYESSSPEPDVGIYSKSPRAALSGKEKRESAAQPSAVLDLVIEQPDHPMGIGIHNKLGQLVTWIEVLSPSNMPGQPHAAAYQANRARCLKSGVPLVEIDLLHEYRSPTPGVPPYPPVEGQTEASNPYLITVSNPRAEEVEMYRWGINEHLPIVAIPLGGHDAIDFNFHSWWENIWRDGRLGDFVDYSVEPARMNKYSTRDQEIIREPMQTIAETRSADQAEPPSAPK